MQGRRRWAGPAMAWAMALGLGSGCDAPERADDAPLLATLDTHHFCDMDAVVEVRLRAHWQACVAGEPGCEPPPATIADGDRYTCPATDATHELGVSLTHPGRYRVEAVAVLTTLQEQPECFVDPSTGDTRIELSRERLLEQAPVVLDEHGPCPP
jgi:hypothetical protein